MFDYLFDATTPMFQQDALRIVVFAIIFFFILGFIARISIHKAKNDTLLKNFWRRVSIMWWVTGGIGALLIFFRQQSIYILGARILMVLWLVWVGAWIVKLAKEYMKKIPQRREKMEKERQRKKYLPGS